MPRKQPESDGDAAVGVAPALRLPVLSAEAAVGPASRIYRSPLSWVAAAAGGVAPSQWAEASGDDGDAQEMDEVEGASDTDDAEGVDDTDDADGGAGDDDGSGDDGQGEADETPEAT